MKKIFLGKKIQGFTLIELIIVIAVLGILAVAVLSAINPLEQIKKANDARRKSNGSELLNAVERYYATYGSYPSNFTFGGAMPGTQISSVDVSRLGDELKAEFRTRVGQAGNQLYAYTDSSSLAHVCFQIESAEQKTKYSGSANYYSSSPNPFLCVPE